MISKQPSLPNLDTPLGDLSIVQLKQQIVQAKGWLTYYGIKFVQSPTTHSHKVTYQTPTSTKTVYYTTTRKKQNPNYIRQYLEAKAQLHQYGY